MSAGPCACVCGARLQGDDGGAWEWAPVAQGLPGTARHLDLPPSYVAGRHVPPPPRSGACLHPCHPLTVLRAPRGVVVGGRCVRVRSVSGDVPHILFANPPTPPPTPASLCDLPWPLAADAASMPPVGAPSARFQAVFRVRACIRAPLGDVVWGAWSQPTEALWLVLR